MFFSISYIISQLVTVITIAGNDVAFSLLVFYELITSLMVMESTKLSHAIRFKRNPLGIKYELGTVWKIQSVSKFDILAHVFAWNW